MSDRVSLMRARVLVGVHHDELSEAEYAVAYVLAVKGLICFNARGFIAWSNANYADASRKALN